MAEDDAPPIRFDDSAVMAALGKHWGAQSNRHLHMMAQPGSYSVQGMDAAWNPTTVPDPKDLLPTLVMQTLIISETKTADGMLIQAVTIPWKEIHKLIKDDPNLIYKIDPWKWEQIIAGSYRASGLFDEVVLTPRSGDHGIDVIATRGGFCSIRCIESVKRYTPGKVVTANDVRALALKVLGNHNVTKGIVSTTWEFAPRIEDDPDIKSLIPHRLELVNRNALIERFKAWEKLD